MKRTRNALDKSLVENLCRQKSPSNGNEHDIVLSSSSPHRSKNNMTQDKKRKKKGKTLDTIVYGYLQRLVPVIIPFPNKMQSKERRWVAPHRIDRSSSD
jgi:hypothetical protein